MDAALDTAMNYLECTGQARNFVEVQRVAAMAILAAWKKGEGRRVKLADLAIQAAERKAKPLSRSAYHVDADRISGMLARFLQRWHSLRARHIRR
jgi:hypothetical protein